MNRMVENTRRPAVGLAARRTVLILLAAAMLIGLSVLPAPLPVSAAETTTVNELEQQIARQEEYIRDLENQLADTKTNLTSALENKSYIDGRINTVNEDITTTEALIDNYHAYIDAKETEIADKEADIAQRFEDFCAWLNLSQKYESTNYAAMFFEADSFLDLLTSAERFDSMVEYQNSLIDSLEADLDTLHGEKEELEAKRSDLEITQSGLQSKKDELDQLASESAGYIKNLKNDQSALESMYRDAVAQEEALNASLEEELARIAKQNTVFIGGDFMWPLDTNWNYLSTRFEWRTLYGVTEFHYGIDIPASGGSYIYASNGGKVIKATSHSSYGNYVLIDHGGGKATLYAHCSSLAVSEGDEVSQGDVIAYVGTTGYSTGNHLHFEVRINGERVDPLGYVAIP